MKRAQREEGRQETCWTEGDFSLGEKRLLGPLPQVHETGISAAGHVSVVQLRDLLRWQLVCSVQLELYRWNASFFTS